jgi:hypothetical protein
MVTLKKDAFSEERILLWSLGIEEAELAEPRAAVLYGRARWIGPLLRGAEITAEILYNILSVVGADCECNIDPRVMRGTSLPVEWDEKTRSQVAKDLGFDPDNPMVMTEVSQILRMGTLFYPEAFSRVENSNLPADDLPVPFVDDAVPYGPPDTADYPFASRLWIALAGTAGIVLIAGVYLFLRSIRRAT